MYKFEYPVDENVDLNEINDKASSLFIKRCMVNRFTTFKSVSDYYEHIDDAVGSIQLSYARIRFYTKTAAYNINYPNGGVSPPWSYNGSHRGHFDDLVKYTDGAIMNNVYLGCHNGRVYVVMGIGKIDGIHSTVIESFPINLLRAPYTKEYYNDNYTTFERIFNQRTITVVNGEKTYTYIPSKITKAPHVKSLGVHKSIDGMNLSSILFEIGDVSCSDDYELEFGIGFGKIAYTSFSCLLSKLVDIVGSTTISKLIKKINGHGDANLERFTLDQTFIEFFSIVLPDDDIKELTERLKTTGVELFDDEHILIHNSIEFCLALYGFSCVSLVSNIQGMFVQFDDFLNESHDDHNNGFPYGKLMRHPEFSNGDLVRIDMDNEGIYEFKYTTLGERVIPEFMGDNEKLLSEMGIDRNDVNRKLLSLNYYMSQKFFREVVHTAWFNKNEIKDMMKRCSYVSN